MKQTKLASVLREADYSHKEALQILEITQDTLMSWYKRDLVPLPKHGNPGRGHRRKYSIQDLVTLHMMKLVTPYVGQAHSTLVSHDCAWITVERYLATSPQEPCEDEFPNAYLVLTRRELDFAVDFIGAGQLEQFLRDLGTEITVIINLRAAIIGLFSRVFEAKKQR